MDEEVALYDRDGGVVGSAPRSTVRAQNLHHAASSVVVRDRWGHVYVHRRSPGKDAYPGLLDFCAGGVVRSGEDPDESALREVDEELGVSGVHLAGLGDADYTDDVTSYRGFLYTTTFDGPIRWQVEEVVWGDWVELEDLLRHLDREPQDFVPDSPALWRPQLDAWAADRVVLPSGWDSVPVLVEGRWVERTPQRPDVARQLLAEVALMPVIADRLPLEVPVPRVMALDPLRVRHVAVLGQAADPASLTAADGRALGRFLKDLHAIPLADLPGDSVPDAAMDPSDRAEQLGEFERTVLPLLPAEVQDDGLRLLRGLAVVGEQALTHADLVAEHLVMREGSLVGIIDWGDARVTDPALDLAWPLHGTPTGFSAAIRAAYGVTEEQERRSREWYALLPWFDAHRGAFLGDLADRDRGVRAVAERLESRWPPIQG